MKQSIYTTLAFILASFASFAQQFNYFPAGANDNYVVTYREFALSYNNDHKQPNWIAYELTAEELGLPMERKDYFKEDNTSGLNSALLSDYKYSGYDRGHLSRAMFNKADLQAYKESFLLSNISPQIGVKFNRAGGIWYKLEELEITFAYKYGRIYSVSGPVFKDKKGTIGANKVTVPGYFYKAFLLPDHKAAIAFIVRHEVTDQEPIKFAVSIDSLEAFTGIDFYPALEDGLEDDIEGKVDFVYWPGEIQSHRSYTSSGNSTPAAQCKGHAKTTGNQCKRKTTNANGYCWQHEDQADGIKKQEVKKQPANDGRCKATTQAGNRCKRSSGASGYCWQHD